MAADIAIMAEEIIKTRARLNEIYAEHTGQVSHESSIDHFFRPRGVLACCRLIVMDTLGRPPKPMPTIYR